MSSPSRSPNAPLSDDEIDALADLVDVIDERTDVPVSLEGLDGFVTALLCGPRAIPPEEYFPVLLDRDDGLVTAFDDEADAARFLALFERRRNEIARLGHTRLHASAASASGSRSRLASTSRWWATLSASVVGAGLGARFWMAKCISGFLPRRVRAAR